MEQDKRLTEIPEGWIAEDEEIVSFDKQVKIRRSAYGYVAWTIVQKANDETGTAEVGKWLQISNFTVKCTNLERFVDDDQRVQRLVEITDDTRTVFETTIEAEEMNTLSNFTKWLESKGNYTFTGTGAQLSAVKLLTFPPAMKETSIKNISGHDEKAHTWIFQNGAVCDGKIYRADDQDLILIPSIKTKTGLILPERTYKLQEADLEATVARLPRLKWDYTESPQQLLREMIADLSSLWGPQTEMAMGWMLAVMFRSRCIRDLRNFPLLFISSPPKQGKTTMLLTLMQMFGLDKYVPRPLSQLTETSVYTLANVFCDIPVWYDEYKEDLIRQKLFLREALKNNYDGSARTVGTTSQFVTKSRVARTGLIITGEMRASDSALDSRCVSVELNSNGNPELLKRIEINARNLQCVVVEILKNYEDLWKLMFDRSDRVMKIFLEDKTVQIRGSENYAKVCAALDVFIPDTDRPFRFAKWLGSKIEQNQDTNVMAEMVRDLPYLIRTMRVAIPFLVDRDAKRLAVNADIFKRAFFERRRDLPRYKTDELIRLGKDGKLMSAAHAGEKNCAIATRVNVIDGSGQPAKQQLRCFVFDMNNEIVADVADHLEPK